MILSPHGTARSGDDRGVIRGDLLGFPNLFFKFKSHLQILWVWAKPTLKAIAEGNLFIYQNKPRLVFYIPMIGVVLHCYKNTNIFLFPPKLL